MVRLMSRALAFLFTALALLPISGAVLAQAPAIAPAQTSATAGARVVVTARWVEEWDPVSARWVQVDDHAATLATAAYEPATTTTTHADGVTTTETVIAEQTRYIAGPVRAASWRAAGIAQYGPFRVLDDTRATLVATTDAATPQAFAAMLAAHPRLAVIEFADAPGTDNDLANLKLGRAIRAAGLATHVPASGSARSGAVELFLAGTRRTIAPGALFAVHSWRDARGREPADFAADAPENRLYLDYYAEMGMSADAAREFYAMTNSVSHAEALWLEGADMARWIAPVDAAVRELSPVLAAKLRLAVAQSGGAMIEAALTSFGKFTAHEFEWPTASTSLIPSLSMPSLSLKARAVSSSIAPQLAYGDLGAALLDSAPAFP